MEAGDEKLMLRELEYIDAGKNSDPGSTDRYFMDRALALARQAFGRTGPNPIVGAVVVRDGSIVGDGYHQKAGSDHAEVVALGNAGSHARGGTLYVSLEPCNHFGKTPPCTDVIKDAGIHRVVFAVGDPAGHGVERGSVDLKKAGIEVIEGVCSEDAAYDNRFFLHSARTGRPWVIAKFGASLDGRVATSTGESKWITGDAARKRAHELRAVVDGILVGSGTVVADNPSLNVRMDHYDGSQPRRLVLDKNGISPVQSALFTDSDSENTIVFTTSRADAKWKNTLEINGVKIIECPKDANGRPDIRFCLTKLFEIGLHSIMVEGGPAVLGSFFDAGLVDEVWAFIAPRIIGGTGAPGAVGGNGVADLASAGPLHRIESELLGVDVLIRGLVSNKEIYKTA